MAVGEAGSGEEAVAVALSLRPDVILMDLRMPGLDGVGATSSLRSGLPPSARVVVLTTYETDEDIPRAVEAGESGYLLRDATRSALASACGRRPGGDGVRPGGGVAAGP